MLLKYCSQYGSKFGELSNGHRTGKCQFSFQSQRMAMPKNVQTSVQLYSFPNLEPIHCSMSSSNCCFLTCIQVFQEAGKVVWYSHLLKYFPQFVVIHTVKGFSIVSEAEVGFFWNSLAFSLIQQMLIIDL